ncbi:hypothetical protein [Hymenobacter ruricola]|uniref:Uncharacterized protein n=1 Tax=Hymenobacter ruricola TaxID=2791023 RepID=A0ABS0I899_9BACT|nr:hypothetical protein [Hymenobacter ruricola]MBF9223194.1 hypothetical protein [Hymenobacter ruricola]
MPASLMKMRRFSYNCDTMNPATPAGCCALYSPFNQLPVMVIEMKPDATPEDVRAALEKLNAAKAAERQRKREASFGAWKTVPDGQDFQRESRNEWR